MHGATAGRLEPPHADHTHDESLPYLGLASDWGYDRFYEDWQEQMARYAAACKGVKWIEVAKPK